MDASATDQSGLLVYSKLRSVEESAAVSVNNIKVAAYEDGYEGFGGYGYCADYDIERLYRDVRVFRILDGASEIHKRLISKHMGVR